MMSPRSWPSAQFHKNGEGLYHCPVLNNVFTDHSHICAVKTSGNVYSFAAVEELNIKPKNFVDLLTGEAFKRGDIIVLQDPLSLQARSLEAFDHVKRDLRVAPSGPPPQPVHGVSQDMRRALDALGTAEASAALAAGGGGSKAQAGRAAADDAFAKRGGGGAALGGGAAGSTKVLYSSGAAAGAGVGAVKFKPGTCTWDTEDAGSLALPGGPAPGGPAGEAAHGAGVLPSNPSITSMPLPWGPAQPTHPGSRVPLLSPLLPPVLPPCVCA